MCDRLKVRVVHDDKVRAVFSWYEGDGSQHFEVLCTREEFLVLMNSVVGKYFTYAELYNSED